MSLPAQSSSPHPPPHGSWEWPPSLRRFEPRWNALQRFLSKGDRIVQSLHLRPFSPRSEAIVGANGWLWLVLLTIFPIIYVGFGLTVSVNWTGTPKNLFPWIDNDYWWHLTAGDYMIDERAMPSPDPWLFTYDGKFVAHEWLGEVFLSVTDRIGGYQAGIVATVLIAAIGFWVLIAAMHRYGLSYRASLLVTVLWMGVILREGIFAVRPQMWTFSFYALLFLFIALYETGRWRTLWVLPPFFLIWFNVHLSAVIGIVALALFGLDQIIRRRPVKHLLIVGVLSLAGIVVNPFGVDYIDQIFRFGGRPEVWNERIFVWLPPDFSHTYNQGFIFSIPMVVPAVWQLLRGRVWPGGMVILFLYQALTSVRFVIVYVLFCMIFAAWLVWQHRQDMEHAWRPVQRTSRPPIWGLALPAAAAAAIVLFVATTYENSQFRKDPVAWGYPVEAASIYLEQGPDLRLFNTYDWGGYLDYRFKGNPQIFIDGRADTYPNELIEQYFHMVDGESGWDAMMNQWDIDVIMIRPIDGLTIPLQTHPDWVEVFNDRFSHLYVRRSVLDQNGGG
ncbi:MAG: hypothetical protein AB7G88_08855 [Thermomicrobiales bacterium]